MRRNCYHVENEQSIGPSVLVSNKMNPAPFKFHQNRQNQPE